MFAAHIPRSVVSAVIPIAVLLLLVTAMPRMPARAQDACLPGDAGACLPLPPCLTLPQPARPPDLDAPVIPAPAALICAAREAIATVNLANDLYVRAVSTPDEAVLVDGWADQALQEISAQVTRLQAAGRVAIPRLLETSLLQLDVSGEQARVRTLERWLYQERDRDALTLLMERDAWFENEYILARRDGRWLVVANTVHDRSGDE
jgi:hypothetical protein